LSRASTGDRETLEEVQGPVTFHIKGTDVVVVDSENNFVTILKDGTETDKFVQQAIANSGT
jgi:hypothetical protein